MSYTSSTTAPTLDVVLQNILSFAVAQASFVDEGSFVDTNTYRIISKGGMYWTFYASTRTFQSGSVGAIYCRMHYVKPTTAANFLTNAGQSSTTMFTTYRNTNGPYTGYYLFTEGTCIHFVLEVYPNVFSHMSFGNVTKLGTFTGGEYLTCNNACYAANATADFTTYNSTLNTNVFQGYNTTISPTFPSGWPSFIRRIDGVQNNDSTDFAMMGVLATGTQRAAMMMGHSMIKNLILQAPNQFNSRSPAYPMYTLIWDNTKELWSLQCYVPGVKYLNVENIVEKEIVETDWQAFPVTQKQSGSAEISPLSSYRGFIYQRIPPLV